MAVQDIVVLANSRKLGGRCVAGICLETGEWMRPISSSLHGALDRQQASTADGLVAELDVVRVSWEERRATPRQPENVLVDERQWELRGRLSAAKAAIDLRGNCQTRGPLLGNRGMAVPEEVADEGVERSLSLVDPARGVRFHFPSAEGSRGPQKPRVRFTLSRKEYDLPVTDFRVGPEIRRRGVGEHSAESLGLARGKILLTVSLGEPHNGWCHKLVAGVVVVAD